jgi:uncharacterized membrane protein
MYSKATVRGHPIHPMLVAFPIAFYVTSLAAFLVFQFVNQDIFWFRLAYFCTYAGVVTALVAAVPGFIDWAFGIPKESAAKSRGLLHMGLNVTALILFTITAVRLYGEWNNPPLTVTGYWVFAFLGVVLTLAAGYHGWELIATHKLGVNMTPSQERLEPIDKMDPRDHKFDTHPRPI